MFFDGSSQIFSSPTQNTCSEETGSGYPHVREKNGDFSPKSSLLGEKIGVKMGTFSRRTV
jgi:hypothetical protein